MKQSFIFIDLWWEILIGPSCFFDYGAYQWLGKENLLVAEELNNALIVLQWTGFGFFLKNNLPHIYSSHSFSKNFLSIC